MTQTPKKPERNYQPVSQVPAHTLPLYATVLQEDYNILKDKLDVCQKECIRIAELYKTDRALFDKEIEKIMAWIDSDPDYTKALGNLSSQNQQLISENAALKEKLAKATAALESKDACIDRMADKIRTLEKEVWGLKNIPHTDNSAVIARLLEENETYKRLLNAK